MTKTAQQRWNENNPEKIQLARSQYESKYKRVTIRFSKKEDKELLDWYEQLNQEDKGKLKSALRDFLYRYKKDGDRA